VDQTLSRTTPWLLAYLGLVILLTPLLFAIHRMTVFHTVPYDDYSPYVLWLAGTGQGGIPPSPYCYRILSVLAAVPFFEVLPPLGLTNAPADASPLWLRASLAINVVNYLAMIAAAVITAKVAIRRCGASPSEGALAGTLLFALAWFTQVVALDGLALLFIAAAVALVERPLAFLALLVISIAVNEKVALVVTLWLAARVVLVPADRSRLWRPCVFAGGALALYFLVIAVLHIPGNEYQLDPGRSVATLAFNLRAYLTGRGVVLNLLPIGLLTGLAFPRPSSQD
jgi:hypothetical protein